MTGATTKKPSARRRLPSLLLTLLILLAASGTAHAASSTSTLPAPAGFEGLWKGLLLLEPGAIEVEVAMELARDERDGTEQWVGSFDQEDLGMHFQPFDRIEVSRDRIHLELLRVIPQAGLRIPLAWDARLSTDGRTITGTFTEGHRSPVAFVLERLGPPGSELPEPKVSDVVDLSPDAAELAARLNRHSDSVRLVALLSPTCSKCLAAAGVLERHLMRRIDDSRLRVYVVWGPMLGDETREAARKATSRLTDPRAIHLWDPDTGLNLRVAQALGQEPEGPAWDVFILLPPGAEWRNGPPPGADYMHLWRGYPEERRLDADALAEKVRALLATAPPAEAATLRAPRSEP